MPGLKHAFVNPKSDGGDATVTRPSSWNADHAGLEGEYLAAALQLASGTALTSLSNWAWAIAASEVWAFKATLFLTHPSLASQGFDYGFTGPTGALITRAMTRGPATTVSTHAIASFGSTAMATKQVGTVYGANAWTSLVEYHGLITNSTNAGTMQFQMSAKVSNAAVITVLEGSHMLCWKVA